MRRTVPVLLTAVLALGAVAVEGEDLTEHPCYDAETGQLAYPEQQVFFHEGESKVGNANAAPDPFDTEPPTDSVQAGAGAGNYTGVAVQAASAEEQYDNVEASFSGTFTGCIDTLLIDMYAFDPTNRTSTGQATAGNPGNPLPHSFRVVVEVDGVEVYRAGPVEANTTFANEALGPNLHRHGIQLGNLLDSYADFGLLSLDGEHTVTIHMAGWYVNTDHSIYVWDTTEVPSGLTFNGEITEDYQPPA